MGSFPVIEKDGDSFPAHVIISAAFMRVNIKDGISGIVLQGPINLSFDQ
jgi:hypothetical protein